MFDDPLVEAGKIELDAPVQRHLPWFRVADPQASAHMTVRHLLNQTSGLPQLPGIRLLADLDQSPGARERQARALATLELHREPGSAFEYSNLNYDLLGLTIEAVSGASYEAYIQDHIFAPLDMRHSYTTREAAERDGLAVGHRYWFAVPIAAPDLPIPRGSVPAGYLISSIGDMAQYLIAHLNGGRYWKARGWAWKGAGWRKVSAVAVWEAGEEEPLVLLTDLPPRWKVARWYDRRSWTEPGFRALKRRGWRWEEGQVRGVERNGRLPLGMAWAPLLALCVGVEAAREALRRLARRARRSRRPVPQHAREGIFTLGLGRVRRWLYRTATRPIRWRLPEVDALGWSDRWCHAQARRPAFKTVRP